MRQYLAENDGLEFIHELIDNMENETWKQITDNMHRPPMIAVSTNPTRTMIHQAAFVMSSKSLICLKIAVTAFPYYEMTNRPLSTNIMMYGSRLQNFKVHMYAIKDMKKDDASEPPNLYKTLAIEEYLESLDFYCASKIGAIMCPLAWVIRENDTVPANYPVM